MGGVELQAHEIYDQLKNNVPGVNPLSAAQQAASGLWDTHTDLVNRINSLTSRMDAAWQGDAAQAAQSGAHPLRQSLDQSATDLNTVQYAMSCQSAAYHTVAAKVQNVPTGQQVPQNNFGNEITPWHTDLDTQIANYNNACDANKQAYQEYSTASTDNGKVIPQQYGTLNTSAASIQMAPAQSTPSSSYGGYSGTTRSASYSGGPGSYSGPGYQPPRPIPGGPTGPGPVMGPQPGGPGPIQGPPVPGPIGTAPVGAWPPIESYPGGPGGPIQVDPGPGDGGGFPGGGVGPGGGSGGFGGGDSSGRSGGSGGGGGRGGRGVGFGGADGEGGSGSGQRGGARGPGGGFGPGEEEGALARGGRPGAAGRPGQPGAGGMGAGRGAGAKGEEDGEHHSASYLESDYSDELIGELGMTAPPVIGE